MSGCAGQQPMPVSASHARAGGFFWVLSPNRHKPHFGQHWRVLFGFEGIIWVRGYYLVYLGRNPVQLREPELLRGTSRATKPVRSKLGKHNKNSYTICIFMTKLIFSVTPHRTVASWTERTPTTTSAAAGTTFTHSPNAHTELFSRWSVPVAFAL